jgi:hypothetical protein
MNDPKQMLAQLAGKASPFAPESRYYAVATATYEFADGRMVAYVRRRFLPEAERLALFTEHLVSEGERLDLIAQRYYGNPELFWRVCDGNNAMRPEDLLAEPGTRIRICLPEGVPGV